MFLPVRADDRGLPDPAGLAYVLAGMLYIREDPGHDALDPLHP